jgi:glucose/arabinose dehydrogenase
VAGVEAPTAGTAGPGDTVWIAQRSGLVRVLEEEGLSDPVLDVSADTTTDGERGLLGIAFDQQFAHFYISYTDLDGHNVVDEFAVADGEPQLDTRRTVLTQEQPLSNHNGGDIAIGPDGMLYLSLGDGGGSGDPFDNGQDLSTLLGTLVRVDPTGGDPYAIPPDNPFASSSRPEIWSYGLRNPWRFSFDRATGDLWIADVGQDAREEINVMPAGEGAGANFVWNLMEGTLEFAGPEPDDHWPPVFEYDTSRRRCAITGGYVYRGETIPNLRGAYLYSDYCEGVIRALDVRDGELADDVDLGVDGGQVVSFVQGPDLELYAHDLGGPVWRHAPL